jgi:Uma2 family endonuclease
MSAAAWDGGTAMAKPAPRRMSLAEFLEWDDGSDLRYELIEGEPVSMAPPLFGHAIVVANLARAIGRQLKPPCILAAGAGVVRAEAADSYFVPDLVVTCEPVDPRGRYLTTPRLIVEILSPTTSMRDRMIKQGEYRAIASLEELVYVAPLERRVQLWRRHADHWRVYDLIGEAELRLESLGLTVPLAAIYENLTLDESA